LLTAVLLAAALAAGCGEDQREAYVEDFRPLSRQIASLGEFTGQAVQNAERRSDAQIEDQFGQIAVELARLRGELEDLDPPDDLADAQKDMADAMRAVEDALRGIQRAAARSDPDAARQSTIELVRASEDLREARRRLAGETP
jgi:TolA-binding protein